MEFEYKRGRDILAYIIALVFIAIGIWLIFAKTDNYALYIMIMIIFLIMKIVDYKVMKGKGMGIVDYLDYGHETRSYVIVYGMIIISILIFRQNADVIIGVFLIISTIILSIEGELIKKTDNSEEGGYPRDKIILNEEGIKIPEYRFIKWEDISNIIEYESGKISMIGVLVSNERTYKIKTSKIEDLIYGKNRRLITIIKLRVSEKYGVGASELVVEMKERGKGEKK
ncbi:hypothetical protein [Oceanirhabdus sp. W0125-5]|uniref:hypothetical protein n=1 Tax=Oceanirhabdus sp. W0125-5 TaxID=2999116 RepID=UPI0022F31FD8|nr:hypothetical protein [Oceanirhabdus sp. W0125-5]WBW96476.1 hypothetical protein OW730_22690 [Oceanirhabdus sp. W0125-5]